MKLSVVVVLLAVLLSPSAPSVASDVDRPGECVPSEVRLDTYGFRATDGEYSLVSMATYVDAGDGLIVQPPPGARAKFLVLGPLGGLVIEVTTPDEPDPRRVAHQVVANHHLGGHAHFLLDDLPIGCARLTVSSDHGRSTFTAVHR